MQYVSLEKAILDIFNNKNNIDPVFLSTIMIRFATRNIIDVNFSQGKRTCMYPVLIVSSYDTHLNQFCITYRHRVRQHGVSGYSCDDIIPIVDPTYYIPDDRCGLYIHKKDVIDIRDIKNVIRRFLAYSYNIDPDYIDDDMIFDKNILNTYAFNSLFNIKKDLDLNRKFTIKDLLNNFKERRK